MKRIMIYVDNQNPECSIELLELAGRAFENQPYQTYAVVMDSHTELAAGVFDYVIEVRGILLANQDTRAITDIIQELQYHWRFDAILIPATLNGRMLAPRVAVRLRVGLVADITDVQINNQVLEMIRPAFSGQIMAAIVAKGKGPVMMSVRPGIFSYSRSTVGQTIYQFFRPTAVRKSELEVLGTTQRQVDYDIRQSQVLVAGGGGAITAFAKLERLAARLQGQVAASRKAVDQGVAVRDIQVGQSGKTVQPRLYLALGIDGAIQHIEGLKKVEYIIAVNTNRQAPICALSDLVVEGEVNEFINRLLAKIDERDQSPSGK